MRLGMQFVFEHKTKETMDKKNTDGRSTYELTNLIIDSTKKFMQALEQGVELGKLEEIRDEVKDLAEELRQKEAEENQQQDVENFPQDLVNNGRNNFRYVN